MLAWRNLTSFRHDAKFSTWLYRIATNAGSPTRASGARSCSATGCDDSLTGRRRHAAHGRRGRRPHTRRAFKLDLERALAVLSDGERAAIVQCYHNDLSHEEAAYVLECPVGTVKTHVLRGKLKLKAALSAYGRSDPP